MTYSNAQGIPIRITGKRADGRMLYEGVDGRVRGGVIPGSYELYSKSEIA